jgi:hypothetical protein
LSGKVLGDDFTDKSVRATRAEMVDQRYGLYAVCFHLPSELLDKVGFTCSRHRDVCRLERAIATKTGGIVSEEEVGR